MSTKHSEAKTLIEFQLNPALIKNILPLVFPKKCDQSNFGVHDWQLSSIKINGEAVVIGFCESKGDAGRSWLAEREDRLVGDDLRQGNNVLSIDTGIEHASDASLKRRPHLVPIEHDSSIERPRAQIKADVLPFVHLMPSYSASIVSTSSSIVME